ncbi:MAG: peptidylprolyl isomerase [Nevskia sp.]|nr:peptidylprolyl isomerase [Nevskia sp.]
MNTQHTVSAIALVLAALSGGLALADDAALKPGSGLAADVIVNGQPISRNHVTLMSTNFSPEKALPGAEAKAAARSELITEELLAQQARKEGLDRKPEVADQLAFQERAILSRAYLEDYFAKNPITDESLKSAYEWNRANGKIVEYKVRQILVPTADQAQQLIDKLNKGEDFADLARHYTQDPGGQANGGDLGWFRPDIFVDHNFADAVSALKKNEYSKAPLRTRFGWHVIKVEDGPRPVQNPPPYDALDDNSKQALRQKTAQLKLEGLTSRLAAAAKVTGPGAGPAPARGTP